ncbi:MAG: neutral zinc metallopeptidase [Bacteroidota bacterium]
MRYKGRRRSTNVRDVRGSGSRSSSGGGGGLATIATILLSRGSWKQKLLIVAVIAGIAIFTGNNPLNLLAGGSTTTQSNYQPTAQEQELMEFVEVVMADTEDVWNKIYRENGSTYKEPQLVVFSNTVQSGCGRASKATGPFYCPADQSAYIDLSFYEELSRRFGAPGDFAMAYVIAHEVGHHIQNLTGTLDKVNRARGQVSQTQYNKMSVMLELQADFYAGVWAHHAQRMHNILEQGDIQEAIQAAEAIGDDRIQRESQGYVVPDSFTHGTSAQRVRWFKKGFETGDIRQGDTFNAEVL